MLSKDICWATVMYPRKGSSYSIWIGIFAWNPGAENQEALQLRVSEVGDAQFWEIDKPGNPGGGYNNLMKVFKHTLDIPKAFDLPALVDANDAIVYDCSNQPIISKAHPLICGKPIVRPSEGKVSDQGRWLSQAHQYANGPEGETEGPGGLLFL